MHLNNTIISEIKKDPFTFWAKTDYSSMTIYQNDIQVNQYSDIEKIHVIERESKNEILIALLHEDKFCSRTYYNVIRIFTNDLELILTFSNNKNLSGEWDGEYNICVDSIITVHQINIQDIGISK